MSDELDPTWEEALATFEKGEPVELIRHPVTLVIELSDRWDCWRASSPQLTGFLLYADTRELAEANARKELEPWLGDHVTLEFRLRYDDIGDVV